MKSNLDPTMNQILDGVISTYRASNNLMPMNFGGQMDELDRQHEQQMEAADRRGAMIDEMIDDIKAADMESIFTDYASCFGSVYTLYFDAPDYTARMKKEIEDCIETEAKARVDNQLG